MATADRVIQDRWVKCSARAMDDRLDALRGRADFLARKINAGRQEPRGRDEREYAALMWAIAELSGIGDEYRNQRASREDEKAEKAAKLRKQVAHFEGLYATQRLKNAELKTQNQALSDELYRLKRPLSVDAVDPPVTNTGNPSTRV